MRSECSRGKAQLLISDRELVCAESEPRFDRDRNDAVNLLSPAASSAESENACLRREVAGSGENPSPCPSMRQEANAAIRSEWGGKVWGTATQTAHHSSSVSIGLIITVGFNE